MCKYPKLIGISAHDWMEDGIKVKRHYIVSVYYNFQSKNYVLYKSKYTYLVYASGFDTKYKLVKHYDYLDWLIYAFDDRIYLNNLDEYFLIQENNIYYAYNFKLNKIKPLDQEYIIFFLSENLPKS